MIRTAYNTTKPTIKTSASAVVLPLVVFAGDQIYVNSGIYQGVYTVFSVSGQYITLDTLYIGVGGSGGINLVDRFINYKAFINVYHGVTNALIDTVYPKPNSKGLLLYDVSGVIRSTVNTSTTTVQSPVNKGNKGISGSFKIGYGATYTIVLPSTTTTSSIPEVPESPTANNEKYYWIAGSKQIAGNVPLTINGIGQNLKEYVPKNISGSAAKFLTMFERPTYFLGFPFFLSFLYDEDFSTVYLDRHQQDVDLNGGSVGAPSISTLNVSERGYVNQMKINPPNTGTASFNVWLETGAAVTGGGVTSGAFPIGAVSNHAASYP